MIKPSPMGCFLSPPNAHLSFFILILFWVMPATARAHVPNDPNFLRPDSSKQWKVLATPHFRIHHETSHKEYAQQLGAVAERVHNKLTAWLDWHPEEKTEIVILDSVDDSNGAATVLPYNQFYIYMPTPAEGEIMDQNPWMEWVFTHEYVHILHLDMAYGDPKVIRDLLGRPVELATAITFPQIFAPSWVTEGLAVYGESDNISGYGRLNSAWYETEMRQEVQRGLRSLSELSFEGYSGSRWPYGQNYLYGAFFFKFISERFGREVAINYVRIYGYNLIPWRMDNRSERIFGKSAEQIWGEFQNYLRQHFAAQPHAPNTRASHILYNEPYFNNSITRGGNGDLYFYHNDASSHPQVRRIRANGMNELLFEIDGVIGLDWHDSAGLLLIRKSVCDNIKLYAELYRWKPGMTAPERMSRCDRLVRAAWSPDGKQIAAVQLDRGLSRLVLLNPDGGHPEQLAELPLGDTLGQVDWSPDGKHLVMSVMRQHTGWNLELFEIKSRRWQQLTLNDDREIRPHYSKDGNAIYFISDHQKVWNLRRINLADNNIVTLSNSVSGIYEAVEMPDNSYSLVEYSPQGQVISALRPDPLITIESYAAYSPTEPSISAIANAVDFSPVAYDHVEDYSALDTLKPRSWVPFSINTADQNSYSGVSLYGSDVLGFHQWNATPQLYTALHTLGGQASYNFLNTLTIHASRQSLVYGSNTPSQYRSDETRYQVLLHHSFNSTDGSLYIAGGLFREHVKTTLAQDNGIYPVLQNTVAGIVARYDDTELYQRAISPSDGRAIRLASESYDIVGSNYYQGKTYQIDWKEFINLGASHVLYLRMLLASGDNGIRPYVLGGEAAEASFALDGSTDLGRRRFMLRGYPAGIAEGTKLGLLSAEWRIPLGLVFDGLLVPPIGLGRHSISIFVDSGDAWRQNTPMQRKTGTGVAWNGETLLGFDKFHIGVTLGIARGFDQGGENQLYFLMGLPF